MAWRGRQPPGFAFCMLSIASAISLSAAMYWGLRFMAMVTRTPGEVVPPALLVAVPLGYALSTLFSSLLFLSLGAGSGLNNPPGRPPAKPKVFLDFKVWLGASACMVALALAEDAGLLRPPGALVMSVGVAAAVVCLWAAARRKRRWRWRGVTRGHALLALVPTFYLAGCGALWFTGVRWVVPIGIAGAVLSFLVWVTAYSLRLASLTSWEFDAQCAHASLPEGRLTQKGAAIVAASLLAVSAAGFALAPSSSLVLWPPLSAIEEFHTAVERGDVARVEGLLGRFPWAIKSYEAFGLGALGSAALHGQAPMAELLLERGADPNAPGLLGTTALHEAAMAGSADTVNLLADHGAATDARDELGRTPLYWAAEARQAEAVKALLAWGAKHDALSAAVGGDAEALKQVLEADPRAVNMRDHSGGTPLHLAAHRASDKAVEVLLAHGADVAATDGRGRTPLHSAAGCGHAAVARRLLQYDADPNARDSESGETPLHVAVCSGDRVMVELLLQNGADLQARTDEGLTPMAVARLTDDDDMAKLLERHGATPTKVIRVPAGQLSPLSDGSAHDEAPTRE